MDHAAVTIAAYETAIEAELARNALEAEGIPTVLADEHLVTAAWHFGRAVGGVKLPVATPDAPRAEAVLREWRARAPAGPETVVTLARRAQMLARAASLLA